jgi:hypothetical protein
MDGIPMQSDQCGDGTLADPLLVQLLHFIVAVLAPGLPRLLLLADRRRFSRWIRIDRRGDGLSLVGFLRTEEE